MDKLHILTCARRHLPTGPDSCQHNEVCATYQPGRTNKPPSAHLPLYVDTIKFSVWFSQQLLQPRGVILVRSRPTPSLRKQPTATRSLQTLTDRYIKEPPIHQGCCRCAVVMKTSCTYGKHGSGASCEHDTQCSRGGTEQSDGGINFYFLRSLTSWMTSQREANKTKIPAGPVLPLSLHLCLSGHCHRSRPQLRRRCVCVYRVREQVGPD